MACPQPPSPSVACGFHNFSVILSLPRRPPPQARSRHACCQPLPEGLRSLSGRLLPHMYRAFQNPVFLSRFVKTQRKAGGARQPPSSSEGGLHLHRFCVIFSLLRRPPPTPCPEGLRSLSEIRCSSLGPRKAHRKAAQQVACPRPPKPLRRPPWKVPKNNSQLLTCTKYGSPPPSPTTSTRWLH